MYEIDINFLNDRPDYKPVVRQKKTATAGPSPKEQLPMVAGIAFALAVNGAVGGYWFWLTQQNTSLQAKLDQLTETVNQGESQRQEINNIKTQANKITTEYQALGTVFDQIKPWSALMRDLGSRIPPEVKITNITQTEPSPAPAAATPSPKPSASASGSPAASPAAAAPPPPPPPQTAKVEISGTASSFARVNDFLLLIQRSPFFKETDTRLVAASLKTNNTQLQLRSQNNGVQAPKLRPVVEYKIETSLSPTPAAELLPELRRTQADGLATRIETLQEKGILAQPGMTKP